MPLPHVSEYAEKSADALDGYMADVQIALANGEIGYEHAEYRKRIIQMRMKERELEDDLWNLQEDIQGVETQFRKYCADPTKWRIKTIYTGIAAPPHTAAGDAPDTAQGE